MTFSLEVVVSQTVQEDEATLSELNQSLQDDQGEFGDCLVVNAESCRLFQPMHESMQLEEKQLVRFALVFVPATIVDSSLEHMQPLLDEKGFIRLSSDTNDRLRSARVLSERLLSMVHPFLAQNFLVKAVVPIRSPQRNAPSDLVVLDLSHTPTAAIADMLDQTTGQTLHSGTENAVLKLLLLSQLQLVLHTPAVRTSSDEASLTATLTLPGDSSNPRTRGVTCDIPTCPVCLHRIDPWRLGIETTSSSAPSDRRLCCSKFCSPPNLLFRDEITCPRQRLLQPWPLPSYCAACAVVAQYWSSGNDDDVAATTTTTNTTTAVAARSSSRDELYCYSCALQETLWVCKTCGFVGCGRYSNKHAAEHYRETGHPFCLELSTLRIWDYVTGGYVHRTDFLECPSSPPVMHPWIPAAASGATRSNSASYAAVAAAAAGQSSQSSSDGRYQHHDRLDDTTGSLSKGEQGQEQLYAANLVNHQVQFNEKSPKKANMIGEEYEALLQSALEEQAQHYEGEITRLRATLTAEQVDEATMSHEERQAIAHLKQATEGLRIEIDKVGRELINLQSQEAGHRALSQRLLREQQVAQEVLKKIREETVREQVKGRQQVDELEQQIDDLTADQRMRHQFSQDQELLNAQIFGTIETENSKSSKKGKKSRRFFRK